MNKVTDDEEPGKERRASDKDLERIFFAMLIDKKVDSKRGHRTDRWILRIRVNVSRVSRALAR